MQIRSSIVRLRAFLRGEDARRMAAWSVAVLAALLLPFLFYAAFAAQLDRLDGLVRDASAAELAPRMRRHDIPRELAAEAASLLQREELGLNYLTLRDADGTILLSDGRFQDWGRSLSPSRARQLRAWLYHFSSDDRVRRLLAGGKTVGRMDYGLDLRRAAANLPLWFWPALLVWLAALAAAIVLFVPARAALARLRASSPDSAPAPAPAPADDSVPEPGAVPPPVNPDAAEWRRIADALGLGVVVADESGRVWLVNEIAGRLIGRPAVLLQERSADELADFTDESGEERKSPLQRCLAGEAGPLRDTLDVNGNRVNMIAARTGDGFVHALIRAALGDRTDERAPTGETFAGTALWVYGEEAAALVDGDGIIRDANPALCRLMEHGRDELIGAPLAWLAPDAGLALSVSGDIANGETDLGDGGMRAAYRLAAIESEGGAPLRLATLRPLDETLHEDDHLTGLPTRGRLMAVLRRMWPEDEIAAPCALLVMEIAGLVYHNRSLGRDVVDSLLAAFAQRLAATAAGAEIVARLGGAEFAVLLRVSEDTEDIEITARRIAEVCAEPVHSGELALAMPVNIGMAVAPEDADSPETLLERAETALSAVRTAGDHLPRRYAPDMVGVDAKTGHAARVLRRALARRELDLRLRPVWHGDSDGAVAAALLEIAWEPDEERRYAGPDLFAHAETLDLEEELAGWCLRVAVETYADWRDIGLTPVPVLVPLSVGASEAPVLKQAWRAAENRYRVPSSAIILFPGDDSVRVAAAGPRVARGDDPATADILCLHAGIGAKYIRTKLAAVAECGVPVIVGPMKKGGPSAALAKAGLEYWYTDADDALSPRVFGRLIARRGAEPL